MSPAAVFDRAFSRLMQHEGGYVNDPADPGGETKYGISKRAYPLVDIAALTLADARAIYLRDYWQGVGIGQLVDADLAARLFNLGVNVGPRLAVLWLQRAVNTLGGGLSLDGSLGPRTAAAVNGHRHPAALLCLLRHAAAEHYLRLGNLRYLAGWLTRLEAEA